MLSMKVHHFGLASLVVCHVVLYSLAHVHLPLSQFNQLLENGHNRDFTPAPVISTLPGRVMTDTCRGNIPGVVCVPPIRCPSHVHGTEPEPCILPEGRNGICCTEFTNQQNAAGSASSKTRSSFSSVNRDALNRAIATGRKQALALLHKENRLLMSGRSASVPEGSPSYGHARHFHISNPVELNQIMDLSHHALEVAMATRTLKEHERFSGEDMELDNAEGVLHDSSLASACTIRPICSLRPSKYRSLDGSCNNIINPALGVFQTPFSRLLPPSYADGVWSPRVSKMHGEPLPSARLICTSMFPDVDRPDTERTLLFMQFGQFLAHDVSRSVSTRFPNGSSISCCTNDGVFELPVEIRHFACMPITVSPQDLFYKEYGQSCLNFVRSLLAPRHECNLGYSQQMNSVSHFLDGSVIYGTSQEVLTELREFTGGRLKMFDDFGHQLLPLSKEEDDCLTSARGSACFATGDDRSNQIITLVVLHTLFAREHNRLADELSSLNPHWTDEIIFLEARKILVAEIQHITYSQWLPEVIGHKAMADFGLNVNYRGYSSFYDKIIDPSITNEFTTAALRFGHSIVDGKLKVYGRNKMEEIIDIPEVMFYPARMRRKEFFDEILTTLTVESPQIADTAVAEALTRYLFRGGNPFGLDLISINIQRGRDHGLRPYNEYRELVGLQRYYHFEDFGHEAAKVLKSLYATPEDVDLYVGGLIESRVPGAAVGPTFRDIIADQFVRLRKGDRYFYDLHPSINPGYLTQEQLQEIKKANLARIICDNSDGIMLAKQALNPFRKPGLHGNELVDCTNPAIPHLNLIHWQERF